MLNTLYPGRKKNMSALRPCLFAGSLSGFPIAAGSEQLMRQGNFGGRNDALYGYKMISLKLICNQRVIMTR